MRTASPRLAPAAAHTACRFSRQRRACSAGVSPASSPVDGSSGICPEQNSNPPVRTAWLYGPMAGGASRAVTGSRFADTRGKVTPTPPRSCSVSLVSRARPSGPAVLRVRLAWGLGLIAALLATLLPAALASAALPGEAPCSDDHGL